MPTAVWPSLGLAAAVEDAVAVAVAEDRRKLVGVGDRHGDGPGGRVGGGGAVGRGHDDHVVLAAAVGGGGLVVRDAVGLEPEIVSPEISKTAWSAPPETVKVTLASPSASLAARVMAFCVFSAMVTEVADENTGLSSLRSTTVTVTVIVSSAESPSPSEAVRTTTHSLSPPQTPASKSGAFWKVSTPPFAT